MIKVINGNSIEELKKFPDNYFGSVVTDPPYGLSFMGKKWDYDVPSVELWQEVFRVLKEGGHLLAFAGTRTQHRMAVNIENAGFEIRDMIAWVYGSGFPKSHNIGKAVDKNNGKCKIDLTDFGNYIKEKREVKKYSRKQLDDIMGTCTAVSWWEGRKKGVQLPSKKMYKKLKKVLDLDNKFDYLINWAEAKRKVIGKKTSGIGTSFGKGEWKSGKTEEVDITIPQTEQAKQWEGWGTALKPALEPITMARKPFKTSVAENVLKNGVGGINIDGCRVATDDNLQAVVKGIRSESWRIMESRNDIENEKKLYGTPKGMGRFPANFIHDGSDEVKDLFPDTASRFFYCAKASKQDKNEGLEDFEDKKSQLNSGGIGRKISVKKRLEKNGNNTPITKNIHPTVKPTNLMRYLIRLVTPKNETVLDCFMGSGSTGKACALEGLSFVGIDLDKEYCKIAKARIDKALEDKRIMDSQLKMF